VRQDRKPEEELTNRGGWDARDEEDDADPRWAGRKRECQAREGTRSFFRDKREVCMSGGCLFVQNMLKRSAFPFEGTSCGGAKLRGSPVIKQKKILATLHSASPGFPGFLQPWGPAER